MFQFPGLPLPAYVFSWQHARITTRRFPHSEILGSTDGQLLPEAYRSRPRPSSALGAKASTVCPSSLDSKEHVLLPLWSFQGARELERSREEPLLARCELAGLSKLNSVSRPKTGIEVDVVPGEPDCPDGRSHRRVRRLPE